MAEVNSRKAALIAEIEISRAEMRQAVRLCEASLNPVEVVRANVKKKPALWISGAALVGVALSRLLRPGSKGVPVPVRQGGEKSLGSEGGGGRLFRSGGWVGSLCSFAFELMRPAIADWAAEQISNLVKKAEVQMPRSGQRAGTE